MISPRRFVDLINGAGRTRAAQRSEGKPIRLATIDPSYTTGNARVTFDGEETLSGKAYPWANYQPVAGARVVMVPQGNGYIILGAIGTAPAGGGGGVTDHGALTGLGDDDHTQYLTQARGDARYYTETESNNLLAGKANSVHQHAAGDISSGSLGVSRGGTGRGNLADGSFLRGNSLTASGVGTMDARTPAQVRADIGANISTYRDEITNFVPTATNTWETWGTSPGYSNPGRPAVVWVNFVGRFRYLEQPAELDPDRHNGGCRVDVSIDGGSTFTEGRQLFAEVRGRDSPAASLLANMALVSGTPTGSIVVRLMSQIAAGSDPILIRAQFMDAAIQTMVIG